MIDYQTRQTLLETLLTAYGKESQLQKTIEALTSLSLSLQRHLRTPCDHEIQILENLADLQLLLDQLRLLFCRDSLTLLTQMEEKKLKREQTLLQTAATTPGSPLYPGSRLNPNSQPNPNSPPNPNQSPTPKTLSTNTP